MSYAVRPGRKKQVKPAAKRVDTTGMISVPEVITHFNISRSTLKSACKQCGIKPVKGGRGHTSFVTEAEFQAIAALGLKPKKSAEIPEGYAIFATIRRTLRLSKRWQPHIHAAASVRRVECGYRTLYNVVDVEAFRDAKAAAAAARHDLAHSQPETDDYLSFTSLRMLMPLHWGIVDTLRASDVRRVVRDGRIYYHRDDVIAWKATRVVAKPGPKPRTDCGDVEPPKEISESAKKAAADKIKADEAARNAHRYSDAQEKAYRRNLAPAKPTPAEQLTAWRKEHRAARKRATTPIPLVAQVTHVNERARGQHRDRSQHAWMQQH